jgi:transcriptional regulator with XRE-family HTH domain
MAYPGVAGEAALMYGSDFRKSKRRSIAQPNAVREAVERVGGIIEASALLRVSNVTISRWMRTGWIPNLDAALKLAEESGIPVERFSRYYRRVPEKTGTDQSYDP